LPQVEERPRLAGVPQPHLLAGRLNRDLGKCFLQPERQQHLGPVGSDLDPGADLLQLRRLLEHLDVEAGAQQRECRGEAADAGARDQDLAHLAHARPRTCCATSAAGSTSAYLLAMSKRLTACGTVPRSNTASCGTTARKPNETPSTTVARTQPLVVHPVTTSVSTPSWTR